MKDVISFRWDIWTFFDKSTSKIMSILAGYPNYAVYVPSRLEGLIKFFVERVLQVLKGEELEDNHILVILANKTKGYLEDFEVIDVFMGDWLLQRNQTTPEQLWKQYQSEIHCGILDDMVKEGVIYPDWLKEQDYQEYLSQISPIIEGILNAIEEIEDQLHELQEPGQYEAVILFSEWEFRQQIKYLRWIIQKGIRKAFPDIIEAMQTEKNPLGWMIEGFNQRIDDLMDESSASDLEDAVRILKRAFRYKPKSSQACTLYYLLAMNYENMEKWEDAIDAYTRMLEVAPPNSLGLFFRAKILHRLNRENEAKEDLEKVLCLPALHLYVLNSIQKQEAQELLDEIKFKDDRL